MVMIMSRDAEEVADTLERWVDEDHEGDAWEDGYDTGLESAALLVRRELVDGDGREGSDLNGSISVSLSVDSVDITMGDDNE